MREDVNQAIEVLRAGGVILYPTDTVWGLGCDATNKEACKKLIKIKKRESNQSMLVVVDSITMLERYVVAVPDTAYELIEVSITPITIIYPKAKNLAPDILADDGSIGIRVCDAKFCNMLLSGFRKPIVSTSANYKGENTPSHFGKINSSIKDEVDYIVKQGQDVIAQNKASSIIKIRSDNSIEIVR